MNKIRFNKLILFATLAPALLLADSIGGEIFIGAFSHSPSGTAAYALPLQQRKDYNIENDFGWSDETDLLIGVSFEHPLPLVPNIKLTYAPIYYSGTADVTDFSWGIIDLPKGKIASDLKLDMLDATLYYQLLDNDTVELDAGLTLRKISGDVTVTTLATYRQFSQPIAKEKLTFDEYIPMLYGKAAVHLADTGLTLSGTLNYFSYNDTTHYDVQFGARYTFMLGLGLEAGYRYTKLQTENDFVGGLYLDADVSGFYVAAVWEF